MHYKSKRRRKDILVILLLILVTSYFIFHAISGKRGILALQEMKKELETSQAQLEEKRGKRLQIEHKTNLMRSESLDVDLLEEQVKKNLGLSKKQERIFDFSKIKKQEK